VIKLEHLIEYIVGGLIVSGAGVYLYFKFKNEIQKGKCANCSLYEGCSKEHKIKID